jgi:hypothetical protein
MRSRITLDTKSEKWDVLERQELEQELLREAAGAYSLPGWL